MRSKSIPLQAGAEGTGRLERSAESLLQNRPELTEILRLAINLLHQQAMPLCLVRQDKVSALQDRVQRGRYKVDPELIAEALLQQAALTLKSS